MDSKLKMHDVRCPNCRSKIEHGDEVFILHIKESKMNHVFDSLLCSLKFFKNVYVHSKQRVTSRVFPLLSLGGNDHVDFPIVNRL